MLSVIGGLFLLGYTWGFIAKPMLDAAEEERQLNELIAKYGKEER